MRTARFDNNQDNCGKKHITGYDGKNYKFDLKNIDLRSSTAAGLGSAPFYEFFIFLLLACKEGEASSFTRDCVDSFLQE